MVQQRDGRPPVRGEGALLQKKTGREKREWPCDDTERITKKGAIKNIGSKRIFSFGGDVIRHSRTGQKVAENSTRRRKSDAKRKKS